jgi:hypothetical protein
MAAHTTRTTHRTALRLPHRKLSATELRRRTAPAEARTSRDLVRATRIIQPW